MALLCFAIALPDHGPPTSWPTASLRFVLLDQASCRRVILVHPLGPAGWCGQYHTGWAGLLPVNLMRLIPLDVITWVALAIGF